MFNTESTIGPVEPLLGGTRVDRRPWEEIAVRDRRLFEDGLRGFELPESTIDDALDVRDEVARQVGGIEEQIRDVYERGYSYFDSAALW